MDVLEALRTRRSIRKYTKEEIPEADIRKIITAAMSGPSAANSQPWHFIIVKSKSILNEIPKASPKWQKMQLLPLLYVEIQPVIKFLYSGSRIAASQLKTYFWLPTRAMVQYGLESIRWRANIRNYRNSWVFHQFPLAVIPIGKPAEKKAIKLYIGRIEFILIHGKIFRNSHLLEGELRISIEHTCPTFPLVFGAPTNPRMHSLNSS